MPWTEEQVDELINNVRRDFALARTKSAFWLKLENRGISIRLAEIITQKSVKQNAMRLLDWLVAFLPTAIPSSPEEAILDDSGDVNALLWHRSELENILQKSPAALSATQRQRLAALDAQIRHSALLIAGAEKGELRRFREGHYDRSHWWWYLDDTLQEELIAKHQAAMRREYRFVETSTSLLKMAEPRAEYKRKNSKRKRRSDEKEKAKAMSGDAG